MQWWQVAIAALIWFVGILILLYGLHLTKESQKENSAFDYSTHFPALGDFSIFGFLFDIISSLIFGLFMKYTPWWLSKSFLILFACLFFYLGILVIRHG
jgi:hypothetical protein